jgi:putative transferase (TIGR04331 family)
MILIKTACDFVTSVTNEESVLLGTWCLKDTSNFLKERHHRKIVPYHWDDRVKFYDDYCYLSTVYEETLSLLTPILNSIHMLNKDNRYWRILLGPWLRFFVDALFDRFACLQSVGEIYPDVGYRISSYELEQWCPNDFPEFWDDFTSDEWNEVILSEIIKFMDLPYSLIGGQVIEPNRRNGHMGISLSSPREFFKWCASKYSRVFSKLSGQIVFVSAYIPLVKLIKLQWKLRQLPNIGLPAIKLDYCNPDVDVRNRLILFSKDSGFKRLLGQLLPQFLPKVYLENFEGFRKKTLRACPSSPRSIFTANAFQADEMFKLWAAEMTHRGVPLIIGQHGGNFGVAKHTQTEEHQLLTCTLFTSWGWIKQGYDNIKPLPSAQLSGRGIYPKKTESGILLVLTSLPRYFYCHQSIPVAGQFLSYLDDQFDFIRGLNTSQMDELTIRLDASCPDRSWNLGKIFREEGLDKKIDRSKTKLLDSVKQNRICVCTHNATVFLETLAMNFPTIIFWDPKYSELNKDAKPFFSLLRKAEILFYSPEEAARKVNSVYDDIDGWWLADSVQSARKKFCERYAATSSDWEREWGEFLLGAKKIS